MLLADGRAALLDFGQCKRLDRTQRAKVAQLMLVLNCRNLKMLKYGMEMTQVQFIQVQISVGSAYFMPFPSVCACSHAH